MNYFDYLGNRFVMNGSTVPNFNLNNLHIDTNFNNPFKLCGVSIFTNATKEELSKLDYEKLVEKQKEIADSTKDGVDKQSLSPLEYILKEFISLKQIKEIADTNKDGSVSAEEMKTYVEELATKDGNADLSFEDFDAVINELGINLEELSKEETQTTDEALNDETFSRETPASQSTGINHNSPVSNIPSNPTVEANPFVPASNRNSNAAVSTPVVKTLDNMTLNELQTEKATREKTVKEKHEAVNSVNNGKNANIKNAKTVEKKAREEYEKAIKEDNAAKTFAKDIEQNNNAIEKNQQLLDKNAVNITNKEQEISKAETSLSSLENDLSAIEKSLTALSSAKADDKNAQNKKSELYRQLSSKKEQIAKQKSQIEKLKKELESLNTEKAKLEDEKKKLLAEKTKLDEKVKANCSEVTKAKLEAYNSATKNVETVKAKELAVAQKELADAQKDLNTVNEKINIAKSNEIKSKYSNTATMDLNGVPESFRKQYGVTEKTMPDGTKVLACSWSRFNKCQKEWIDDQKYMLQAAKDLGLTLVYSDVERTVAESNAGRARKGNIVCKGGQSPHNYGVAADIVLFKDGKEVNVNSSTQTAFAQKVKEYSNNQIEWGGDWRKAGERHHFNVRKWENKYKNPMNLVG